VSSHAGLSNLTQKREEDNWNNHTVTMPQDLPPSGGYEPVQYKVRPPRNYRLHPLQSKLDYSTTFMNTTSRGKRWRTYGIRANEGLNPEKPSRAGLQTKCYAVCGGRRSDIWVLEGWEGDSGTEVRLAPHSLWRSSEIDGTGHFTDDDLIASLHERRCGRGFISFLY
jgi:hypothetical protein